MYRYYKVPEAFSNKINSLVAEYIIDAEEVPSLEAELYYQIAETIITNYNEKNGSSLSDEGFVEAIKRLGDVFLEENLLEDEKINFIAQREGFL